MLKCVVIQNGTPRSGKDEMIKGLHKQMLNIMRYSTVDKVKAIASSMGWNGEKTPEFRKMLSDLKIMYNEHFDGTFRDFKHNIAALQSETTTYDMLIVQTREIPEIIRMVAYCAEMKISCATTLVTRENNWSADKESLAPCDHEVHDYDYNFTLENNGTLEEFAKVVETFVEDLKEHGAI